MCTYMNKYIQKAYHGCIILVIHIYLFIVLGEGIPLKIYFHQHDPIIKGPNSFNSVFILSMSDWLT